MTSSVSSATWRRVTLRAGIAVYWMVMFLATHLPVEPVIERLPTSDKHLHFGAYALLGLALPWWRAGARGARWSHAFALYLIVLVYAGCDELLQAPVGRSPEWGDWLADAAGSLVGLGIGTWLQHRCARSCSLAHAGAE